MFSALVPTLLHEDAIVERSGSGDDSNTVILKTFDMIHSAIGSNDSTEAPTNGASSDSIPLYMSNQTWEAQYDDNGTDFFWKIQLVGLERS